MIEVREVRASHYLDEIKDLAAANWAETGFWFDLDLRPEVFDAMQDTGCWFALAAFEGERIVGYVTAAVVPHHFNPAITLCATDALFVAPDKRHGRTTLLLRDAAEAEAERRGAQEIMWHTRAGTPFAAMLLRRGYVEDDVVVSRRLGNG